MEIPDRYAKEAIKYAYENQKKEEFLERLFDYIKSTIDLVRQEEGMKYRNEIIYKRLTEVSKPKPGPKAKTPEELEAT